jgi:ubiquinone/menaquinone biosynthesis C-methylase UbiE
VTLRDAWKAVAENWVAWARQTGHDSYGRFHRDAFVDLLPAPGRRTVDLGCGEGRLTRDLAARGHRMVAVDAAPTMIRHAREADPSGEYHVASAAELPLADAAADLVVAFMSLQDMDDPEAAVREAWRVLEPGGRFCLALVHPLNSAGRFESDEPEAAFVIAGSYRERARYVETVERDGLEMTFTSDHRSLEGWLRLLTENSFLVEAVREIYAPEEPRWSRIPFFLHVRARKST